MNRGIARWFAASPTLRPLSRRDYRTIWLGALVSNIGTWMETTALGTLIARETHSATQVAVAAIAGFLPSAFASPIGGALADRFDRKRFLQTTIALETFFAALLALLVGLGERRTAPLATVVFLASTISSAALPNRQAVLPTLVPREDLTAAISLGSASWNGGRVFGPLLALLATAIGPTWAFVANALSFLVLLAAWMTVSVPDVPRAAGATLSLRSSLRQGFDVARRNTDVRFAIVFIGVLAGTAGPFIGLLPIVARVRYGTGAALFVTAQGLGAVLGALATTRAARRFGRRGTMLIALIGLVPALLAYDIAPERWSAALAVMLLGGLYMAAFACAQSLLQLACPPELRARTLAMFSVALGLTYCMALLINGPLGDARGLRWSTGFQAGATALGVVALRLRFGRWWQEPAVPHGSPG